MAGNKKPTKKYRPKGVRLNTVDYVRQGLAPLSKNLRVNLLTKVHDAMVEVTQGRGTKTHWVLVADALNTAQVLDEQTFLAAYEVEFDLAHAAHAACGTRFINGKTMLYTGAELGAVNFALQVHEEQLLKATLSEVEHALNTVEARQRDPLRRRAILVGEGCMTTPDATSLLRKC